MTTPLENRLRRRIELGGPISVADYMASCLYDPEHGYYTSREPFGRGGDFITAPEISQMFGEIVAIWLITAWQAAGSPKEIAFAEIGPGRGTLMRDMLRTAKAVAPQFLVAAKIFMIETSDRLTEIQKKTLDTAGSPVTWVKQLGDLPDLPLLLTGNEIFDAIPFNQFVHINGQWHERVIALGSGGALGFSAGLPAGSPPRPENVAVPDGTIFEAAPAREALAVQTGKRIAARGGAALFFDYGHLSRGFGDTFQALRNHDQEDVLASPGLADLTSHVDFHALGRAARKAGARTGFSTQGDFLLKMGLLERAGALGAAKDPATQAQITADVGRLAGTDAMGELFKVMAIHDLNPAPPPFDRL